MTFGEFLSQILGWLGEFVSWTFAWVPRRMVLDWNQVAVHYPLGNAPEVLEPGVHWYIPNRGHVVVHFANRFVLDLEPMALETNDGVRIALGLTVTARISDVLKYEVDNFDTDANILERAKNGLRDIVMEHTWADLCRPTGDGTRLEGALTRRMSKVLEEFGVTVERSCPTDQVRLGHGAYRLFGMFNHQDVNKL